MTDPREADQVGELFDIEPQEDWPPMTAGIFIVGMLLLIGFTAGILVGSIIGGAAALLEVGPGQAERSIPAPEAASDLLWPRVFTPGAGPLSKREEGDA